MKDTRIAANTCAMTGGGDCSQPVQPGFESYNLLDALIDSSPHDVKQGRHPATHEIHLGGASNQ